MDKSKISIILLVLSITILSAITTLSGIFSNNGSGSYTYESIRGEQVKIYGKGIYRHMSADVAIQGIAQDYVTLFLAIPVLIAGMIMTLKGSVKGRFMLAGVSAYFLVTFMFYTAMAMYNKLFLAYAALMGLSFFLLISLLLQMDLSKIPAYFTRTRPVKVAGGFLIFNSIAVALMWLGSVLPPLLNGSIYPESLQHYTTLIVQGFNLGLLLPLAFVSGLLLLKHKPLGYLAGTVYTVFLALLMTALSAKIIAMGLNGVNIIPVVFIIPAVNLFAVYCAFWLLRTLRASPSGAI